MSAIAIAVLVVGGALLSVVLFFLVSIAVDSVVGRKRIEGIATDRIESDGHAVYAYVARPDEARGRRPAVIMIHEFFGLQPETGAKAEALAQEGYVVVAPDAFRGGTTRWYPRALFLAMTVSIQRVIEDLDRVWAWLEARPDVRPDRIAVMGFCYGGGVALRYGLHSKRPAALAIFYGRLVSSASKLRSLSAPVLGIFGEEDPSIPIDRVREFDRRLKEAEVPHRIVTYEGVGHAFVRDVAAIEAGGAARDAWQELLQFLAQHLGR